MALEKVEFSTGYIDKPAVNYGAFAKDFAKVIADGLADRDTQNQTIRDNQEALDKEFQEIRNLAATSGDFMTPEVVTIIEKGSMQLNEANRLFKQGKLTNDQWITQKNKINNSATNLKAFMTSFNELHKEAVDGQAVGSFGDGSSLSQRNGIDAYNMEKLGAIAQMKSHGFEMTANGDILFVKKDQNGKAIMTAGNVRTLPSALASVVQKYNTVDMEKQYDAVAANIKPVIQVKGGKISTIEDAYSDPDVQKYIKDAENAIINDDNALQSVWDNMGVVAPNGKPYEPTQDLQDALNNSNKVLMYMDEDGVLNFLKPGDSDDLKKTLATGNYSLSNVNDAIDNYERGVTSFKDNFQNGMAARLKLEEKFREIPQKSFNKAEFDYKAGLKQAISLGNLSGNFYDGDETAINNAGETLAKQNIKRDDKTNIKVDLLKREPGSDDNNLAVRLNYTIYTRDDQGKVTPDAKSEVIEIKRDGEVLLSKHGFTDALFATFYGRPPTDDERKGMSQIYGKPDSSTPTYSSFERQTKSVKGGSYNDVNVIGASKQGTKVLPHFVIQQKKNWSSEEWESPEKFDEQLNNYVLGLNGAIDASVDFDEFKVVELPASGETAIQFNYNGQPYSYSFTKGEDPPPYDKVKRAFEAIANNRPL